MTKASTRSCTMMEVAVSVYVGAAVAFLAVVIGYMQHFLARQKFVLDLFERRYKAYSDVFSAVRSIIADGRASHVVGPSAFAKGLESATGRLLKNVTV